MKKVLISLLLLAAHVGGYAQLKVLSNGRVTVASTVTAPAARITVGESADPDLNNIGISSVITPGNSGFTAGMASNVFASLQSQSRTCGVLGVAGNGMNGYNYGVYGILKGRRNGAGVLGAIDGMVSAIVGQYAGYFYGDTRVVGNLTANSLTNLSDRALLNNVQSLSDESSSLENIMNLNAVSFNYENEDTVRHFGMVAQELQKVYPDLVKKGEDGFLAVNYVEIVPILIRSIQELKGQVEELQGKLRRSVVNSPATSDLNEQASYGNVLYQNTPNPFKDQTVIRFRLADDARNASICIFDMTGKQLRKLPISSGDESVTVGGYELGQGMFLYSLIVDGQEIDTKKMIITK